MQKPIALFLCLAALVGLSAHDSPRVSPAFSIATAQDPLPPRPDDKPEPPKLELSILAPALVAEHTQCKIEIQTNAKFSRVTVWQSMFETVPVFELAEPGCYLFTAPPGSYRLEVDAFDPVLGIGRQVQRVNVEGKGDDEDDDKDPDDEDDGDEDEDPDDGEAPFAAPGLAVLIIKEAKDDGALPESQKAIFTSAELQTWLKNNCEKENGLPLCRFWDDDYTADDLANTSQTLRDAYAKTLQARQGSAPWIAISNGKSGTSEPLPQTVEETLELIQRFKG